MREIVVIGAGIAGATVAYTLQKEGFNVLLIDKSATPPTGGSMAAGAFISPKIGKGSPLQELTNKAFDFSWRFYKGEFEEEFFQDGILRIPKNLDDAKKFEIYKNFNYKNFEVWNKERLTAEGLSVDCDFGFFFPDAGDCNAQRIVSKMVNQVEFLQMRAIDLEFVENYWKIKAKNKIIESKSVILALGYENNLINIDMDYLGIKALWGSRGDFEVKNGLTFSLHKDFSISSVRGNYLKIGATHIKAKEPCMVCDGNPLRELEQKAKIIAPNISLKLLKIHCAYRSGSRDFFPVVGKIVDVEKTIEKYPNIKKGAKKVPIYHPNLYLLNGLGGRGFVFAPYLANILKNYILHKKEIPESINSDRLFLRWVRRLKSI